ncbi:MAG: PEP-CTERM sorting domain-containing protein [Chlorobaculum sp.]|nr:PEP-CTERM sorting domain-containing protein [Chlorobaculum sp.]
MKKVSFILSSYIVALFACNTAYALNHADIISIRMGTLNSSITYTGDAAIDNGSAETWNRATASGNKSITNLKLAKDGSPSGVSVSYYMTTSGNFGAAGTSIPLTNIDQPLMRGYMLTDSSHTGNFNFSGLTAGNYTVYVYSQMGKNATSYINMGASTQGHTYSTISLTNPGTASTLTYGVNWIKESVTVGSDGLLNLSFANNNQINGIQIQALPEPNSLILIGVGGVFVFSFMKRKQIVDSTVND